MYELIRKHTSDAKESLLETSSNLEDIKAKLRMYIAELPLNYIIKFSNRNKRADVWTASKFYLMSFYINKV